MTQDDDVPSGTPPTPPPSSVPVPPAELTAFREPVRMDEPLAFAEPPPEPGPPAPPPFSAPPPPPAPPYAGPRHAAPIGPPPAETESQLPAADASSPPAADAPAASNADPSSADPSSPGAAQPADAAATPEAAALAADADADAEPITGSPWQRYRARRRRRKASKAQKPHRKAPWWELPGLIVVAILIAILVKSFVVQPFYIPSDSMEKTLHGCTGCSGDRILVNKVIYDFRAPHAGDIVVFNAPPTWQDGEATSKPPSNPFLRAIRGFGQLVGVVPPDGKVLVKRVIATGGETVKGDAAGHVMISTHGPAGPYRTLVEPYVYLSANGAQQTPFGPVTIPKGRLWVMGDHRNDSADSRYHCSGDPTDESTASDQDCDPVASTIPIGDVIGKAFVIAWPPSRWRTLGTPSTFTTAEAGLPMVPSIVAVGVIVPVVIVRRRRRRRSS